MSQCSFCGNRSGLKCPLSPDWKTDNSVNEIPLCGQVFGLPPPSEHQPSFRKKLTERELREGIDQHQLWSYVPFWQVPRVDALPGRSSRQLFVRQSISMRKILSMAKKNKTLDGYIGRLNFNFPHFGKRKPERPPEETGIASLNENINKMKQKIKKSASKRNKSRQSDNKNKE